MRIFNHIWFCPHQKEIDMKNSLQGFRVFKMLNGINKKIKFFLEEHQIIYQEITHKPAASAEEYHQILGTRYEQQAKALLIRYKKPGVKGFVVVTIPAQKRANLEQIKNVLQAKSVRLAEPKQLQEVTGCNFGELPPLGKIFGLQLLMDQELLLEPKIYFNAGKLDLSIVLSPKDLQKLEEPILL